MDKNQNVEEDKNYAVLQKDIEATCKILLDNSFHEFADLNYKTERRYNSNCKKALFDYYDKNYFAFGHQCIDELVGYIEKSSSDTRFQKSGYNVYIKQISNWLEQIENNYETLKQEYANEQQQKETKATEAAPQSDASKEPSAKVQKILLKLPPGLSREERKELEDALFKAGARYSKETISAEHSNSGKEVHYKSWYVMQNENTDMTPFQEYIRPEKHTSSDRNVSKSNTRAESNPKPAESENRTSTPEGLKENIPEQKNEGDRIYLNLPHMGKSTFAKVTAELSQKGAKFDGEAKAWYITGKDDFNQFKKYLGLSRDQVVNKRESVLDKLHKNKEAVNNRERTEAAAGREVRQNNEITK